MSAWVYRCYDDTGRLIYIGRTENPEQREKSHRHTTPWWNDVATVEYADHITLSEAQVVEGVLIRAFKPTHNKQFVETQTEVGIKRGGLSSGACSMPGCDTFVAGFDMHRFCDEHRKEVRRRKDGDDSSLGIRRPNLTDEQKVEIRRRMSRFENPKDIARSLGVTAATVLRVSKAMAS